VENRDLASPALKSSVIALDQPAVIQWNTDGLVMSWNPAAERLLGLPAEDAVGKNVSELFARAGSFIDERSRLRLFTECRAVDAISHTATKAGKHAFVSWSHAPVTGEGGNAICAVSTGRAVIAPDQHLDGLWLSEQGYRKIFEESPLGMIIVDTNYRPVKANAMVSRVLGYTEQELLNLTFSNVTHPDDVGTYATHVRDLLTGRIPQFNVEKRHIAKNGATIWVSVTASPIHDEKGNIAYVFILVEDITDRKRAEESLRESETHYRTVFETAPNLFVLLDASAVIIDCNPRIEGILGYQKSEVIGRPVTDFVVPEYRRKVIALHKKVLTTGFTRGNEYKMVRKDGRVIDALTNASGIKDNDGRYASAICIIADVTERKKTRNALRFTRFAVDHAATSFFWVREDGSFLDVNGAACREFGYTRDELLEMSVFDINPNTPRAI